MDFFVLVFVVALLWALWPPRLSKRQERGGKEGERRGYDSAFARSAQNFKLAESGYYSLQKTT